MFNLKFSRNILHMICLLIILTLVVHAFIGFYAREKSTPVRKKVIRDHEEALCNFRLNRSLSAGQPMDNCPDRGIVTVFFGGSLHIQMWAYASVWAASKVTNLVPFIPICLHDFLSTVFIDLSVRPLSLIPDCDIPLPKAAQLYEDWSDENQSLVLPVFTCLTEIIMQHLPEVIGEFRIRKPLLEQADDLMRDFALGRYLDPVFVGVHIPSKWEYVGDGLNYPDKDFYERVFKDIREEKGNDTVFVMVSSREIRRNNFPGDDILFMDVDRTPVGLNLALLSICNVSVLGFQDVGFWGALFSGGEVIAFDAYDDKFIQIFDILPKWRIYP